MYFPSAPCRLPGFPTHGSISLPVSRTDSGRNTPSPNRLRKRITVRRATRRSGKLPARTEARKHSHRETMVDLVRMENVAIKMSAEELRALLEMVDNQLFRMKYIDSKIPGHQKKPEELKLAAAAVGILREAFNRARGIKTRAAAETKP